MITVELDVPAQAGVRIAKRIVAKRKWMVIDEREPQPPRRLGASKAVANADQGFRDDGSIREVTPDGDGSSVDIRSASRYFESDSEQCERIIQDDSMRKAAAEAAELQAGEEARWWRYR